MPCQCGRKLERRFSSSEWEDTVLDERQMVLLANDPVDCAPYTGAFQGTHVHLVGQGTEHERIFLRNNRKAAIQYAVNRGVKVGRLISVKTLCHQRVVEALGA